MTSLYLGLDPKRFPRKEIFHYPVIRIVPKYLSAKIRYAFSKLDLCSHLVFTSRPAVRIFFEILFRTRGYLGKKKIIAVGEATAEEMKNRGLEVMISQQATQEGVMEVIAKEKNPSIFWPKSSKARLDLARFLCGYEHVIIDIYDTEFQKREPVPCLQDFNEIVFTSPSTVDAFLQIYDKIPDNITLTSIGPITKAYMRTKIMRQNVEIKSE